MTSTSTRLTPTLPPYVVLVGRTIQPISATRSYSHHKSHACRFDVQETQFGYRVSEKTRNSTHANQAQRFADACHAVRIIADFIRHCTRYIRPIFIRCVPYRLLGKSIGADGRERSLAEPLVLKGGADYGYLITLRVFDRLFSSSTLTGARADY